MVRVLHYIGSLQIGGSQALVMEWYRKIDRTKMQFDFVTFPEERKGSYDEVERMGGRVFVCPRYSGFNHFEFVKWWSDFLEEHPEYRIVHGHIYSCASIYMPVVKKHGRIAIAHSHSTSNGKGFASVVKAVLQLPIRHIANYMFSCSDLAGIWLYGKKAVKKPNYRMIPNCVDCRRFAFSEEIREDVRKELGIGEKAFVVGHVGRFHESKNHEFLVRVFVEILKQRPDAMLLLVGDGDLLEPTKTLCGELGITDHVIFTGAQLEPDRYYQAMDLFLFPSVWEGLPVSVVEAQANGLPCLLSDTITKDVWLTDLVTYETLEKDAKHWAGEAVKFAGKTREPIGGNELEKLKGFDSNQVVADLQEFYLSL